MESVSSFSKILQGLPTQIDILGDKVKFDARFLNSINKHQELMKIKALIFNLSHFTRLAFLLEPPMKCVNISALYKPDQRKEIIELLNSFDEDVEIVGNPKDPRLMLKIFHPQYELSNPRETARFAITLACLREMKRRGLNPFTFGGSSKRLLNLSLLDRKCVLEFSDPHAASRTKMLISLLGGTTMQLRGGCSYIISDHADVKRSDSIPVVHFSWIEALTKKPNTKMDGYLVNAPKIPQEKVQKDIQKYSQVDAPLGRYIEPQLKAHISEEIVSSPILADGPMPDSGCSLGPRDWLRPSQNTDDDEAPEQAEGITSQNMHFQDDTSPVLAESQPSTTSPGMSSPPDHSPGEVHTGSARFREICKVIMLPARTSGVPQSRIRTNISFEELTAFSQARSDSDSEREYYDVKYGTAIVGDLCPFRDDENDPLMELFAPSETET
jgi:hypothetical protein